MGNIFNMDRALSYYNHDCYYGNNPKQVKMDCTKIGDMTAKEIAAREGRLNDAAELRIETERDNERENVK